MGTEDNKAIVRRVSEEFWNEGRAEVIDEVFAADVLEPRRLAPSRSPSSGANRASQPRMVSCVTS